MRVCPHYCMLSVGCRAAGQLPADVRQPPQLKELGPQFLFDLWEQQSSGATAGQLDAASVLDDSISGTAVRRHDASPCQ
jgi:hypothetical protein